MENNKIECWKCIHFEEFSIDDDYSPIFVCVKSHEMDNMGFYWELNHTPKDGNCEDFEEWKE